MVFIRLEFCSIDTYSALKLKLFDFKGRKERIVEEYLNNGWSQVPWSTIGSPKSFYKEGSVPKYEAISWVKGHNKIPLLTDSIPVWFDNQVVSSTKNHFTLPKSSFNHLESQQKYGDKLLFEVVHQNVKFTWNSFNVIMLPLFLFTFFC